MTLPGQAARNASNLPTGFPASLAIRHALPAEAPVLAAMRLDFMRIVKTGGMGAGEAQRARTLETRIRRRIASGASVFFVCVREEGADIPSGAAQGPRPILASCELMLRRPGYAEIANLHVDREWRRLGIGSALLDALIGECAGRGIEKIVLQPTEDGRTIYARAGFQPARRGSMELGVATPGTGAPPFRH